MIVTDTSLLVPLLRAKCLEIVSVFDVLRVSKDVEKEILRVAPECTAQWEKAKASGAVQVQTVPSKVRDRARALDGKYRLGIVDCIGIEWAKDQNEELAMEDGDALDAAEAEGVETITIAAALLAHAEAGRLSKDQVSRLAIRIELDGDHEWGDRDRALLGA